MPRWKTQKTPAKEINRAKEYRQDYMERRVIPCAADIILMMLQSVT